MARRVKKKETIEDGDLRAVREQFEEYADTSIDSRALAAKCRQYRDGEQWTDDERKKLAKRGQPCITDNKIQDKCDTLLGLEKQMRTSPKAYPRTPNEDQGAEAVTDALRYVTEACDYQRTVRKPAADNLMVEGLCAGIVPYHKDKGKYGTVCPEHVRWDRVYYDPRSLRDDFEDKEFCGYFTWMDVEVAKQLFPSSADALNESLSFESISGPNETHDDKPRYAITVRERPRVQVFYHYRRKAGVWHEGVWCRGGWLEPEKPCAYKDEDGQPMCAMELQALYRDGDGNPYGLVPRYLDLQDEHNKRRSKMLHLLNAKRIVLQKGTHDNLKTLREEVHKPDGVVEVKGDIAQFRVDDNLAEAQGQWQLLQQTDAALAATGPNAALAGQSGSISGRAKELDQVSGMAAVSPLFDALESFEVRMYRQAWARIRQYWTAEMWIRVTDDEQKLKFVPLNQRMTNGDISALALRNEKISDEEKAARIQEIAADPASQQQAVTPDGKPVIRNNVVEMDVDIIIDRAPNVMNLQQETFQVLAELGKTRPEVPFDVIVEASPLRSDVKKKMLDKMAQSPQMPPEVQQAMQEMQAKAEQLAQAEAAVTEQAAKVREAEMGLSQQSAELDVKQAQIDAAVEKLRAEAAKLDAREAELNAAERTVVQSVETAQAKIDAHAARTTQAASADVMSEVQKLLAEHAKTIDTSLANTRAELASAMSSRQPRSFSIQRADGKTTRVVEE